MEHFNPRRRRSPLLSPRIMFDLLMALLMLFFGYFIVYSHTLLGYDYFEDSWFLQGSVRWIVAGLFVLYGVFRVYRAYLQAENEKIKDNESNF